MKLFKTLATVAIAGLGLLSGVARADVNLFCWSEYVPQEVIDGFTKETGIKVNQENYASNEEMLAKLKSGSAKYDLIQPSEYTVEALIKDGALAEIDWAKVPNIKNIGADFQHQSHDPDQKYTVPWMSGTVGICVNTEKVKDPITGYADVFSGKYNGRIVALNDSREICSWAMNSLGLDINKPTPENLEKIKPALVKWIPQIKVFDSDSPKTALINGDVDLGIVWSGEAALCYKENKKFAYVLPKEGAHKFIDSLCMPKDAPNKDDAQKFMNYILKPEVSKIISEKFPYTNPNKEAVKLLSPEELSNPASYPKGNPKLELFHDVGKAGADMDTLISQIKG